MTYITLFCSQVMKVTHLLVIASRLLISAKIDHNTHRNNPRGL